MRDHPSAARFVAGLIILAVVLIWGVIAGWFDGCGVRP